jgi:CBS domain-containing protein
MHSTRHGRSSGFEAPKDHDSVSRNAGRLRTPGDLDCVPIVDERGGPIGIVSKTDFVRLGPGVKGMVGKIMTACVHALPESSSLAHAFALMTLKRLQHVPIVSGGGVVVGVLTALDALRWVTEGWGYLSFEANAPKTPR